MIVRSIFSRRPRRPPRSTRFPYTTLFRSTNSVLADFGAVGGGSSNTVSGSHGTVAGGQGNLAKGNYSFAAGRKTRSEEHTSELQSRFDLVCRLLLEKKKDAKVAYLMLGIC